MTRFITPILIAFLMAFVSVDAHAQAPRDPRALVFASQALRALTDGTSLKDVVLQGQAAYSVGSDVETGPVTLEALGGGAGRVILALSGGQRIEVVNQLQGAPTGQWSGPDGAQHAMAMHNCFIPATWFSPALALAQLLNDPTTAVAYIGQEALGGEAVQHLRFWRVPPGASGKAATLIAHLSTVDVYLNAASSLPVALSFNLHPDRNESLDLPVEIRFSSYQKLRGFTLPMHIEKLTNGGRVLDLNLSAVRPNTGIQPSEFAVATAQGGQQ